MAPITFKLVSGYCFLSGNGRSEKNVQNFPTVRTNQNKIPNGFIPSAFQLKISVYTSGRVSKRALMVEWLREVLIVNTKKDRKQGWKHQKSVMNRSLALAAKISFNKKLSAFFS